MSLPNLTHEQRLAFADLLGSKNIDCTGPGVS